MKEPLLLEIGTERPQPLPATARARAGDAGEREADQHLRARFTQFTAVVSSDSSQRLCGEAAGAEMLRLARLVLRTPLQFERISMSATAAMLKERAIVAHATKQRVLGSDDVSRRPAAASSDLCCDALAAPPSPRR